MKRLASIILLCFPLIVQGQITVDGDCSEPFWRILALVNTTGTPNTSFGSSNTLGVIKYHSNATTLFVAITGNVDANNNIVLFMDDASYNGRGPNPLGANMRGVSSSVFRTSSGSCPAPEPNGLAGARMDVGFDADFAFAVNKGNTGTNLYMDAVRYSNYINDPVPTPAYIAGPVYIGNCNQSGATASYGVNVSGWNSGSSQISFAWQNGYEATSAPNKGLEISIPYACLPGVAVGHQLRFFALITNFEGFASNVCIPGDPGASHLGCNFNLSTITNSGRDIFYTDPLVALPLSFLGLKPGWEGEKVRLDWSVAEQGEAGFYSVEHSADGFNYASVGRVMAGTEGATAKYKYLDPAPIWGSNYYRIVAHKRMGGVTYSKSVRIENQRVSSIGIYPNPTRNKLFVRLGGLSGRPCSWSIYTESGQRVLSGQITVSQTLESIVLPPSLPAGTYRFSLFSEEKSAARSFQIRR